MKKMLKNLLFISAALCIPAGFFAGHEHAVFFWHKIPSVDVIFGFFGAFLLIFAAKILASFVRRKEDFYD